MALKPNDIERMSNLIKLLQDVTNKTFIKVKKSLKDYNKNNTIEIQFNNKILFETQLATNNLKSLKNAIDEYLAFKKNIKR